ncbi:MAG TPA: hypothetical protein VER96_39045 [Polyangiaceae bacterium]|nr:hypothetical protein [Polyangiaceae bacterium]
MSMCPPMPPKDASECMTQVPPAAPCHYEAAAVDCACVDNKWTCSTAP